MARPGCRAPRSESSAARELPGLTSQKEKGFQTAPHLPWKAVAIGEDVIAIEAAPVTTGKVAPCGGAAAGDLTDAGVLG